MFVFLVESLQTRSTICLHKCCSAEGIPYTLSVDVSRPLTCITDRLQCLQHGHESRFHRKTTPHFRCFFSWDKNPVARIALKIQKMKNLGKNTWVQTLTSFVSVDYEL